jgi:hypothetical protein
MSANALVVNSCGRDDSGEAVGKFAACGKIDGGGFVEVGRKKLHAG